MFKAFLGHYMTPHQFFLLLQGPRYKEIGDGVYSFTSTGRFDKRRQSDLCLIVFSQALILHVVVTSSGVVVLDPMNMAHSREMLTAIREVTSLPVTHVM